MEPDYYVLGLEIEDRVCFKGRVQSSQGIAMSDEDVQGCVCSPKNLINI